MKSPDLTAALNLPEGFEFRPELAAAATSRELHAAPRHRWFYFPHSFSYRLVDEILDLWDFPATGTLVDNFVGSGTTLVEGARRGLQTAGFDLSPLSVTVTNVKTGPYDPVALERILERIMEAEPAHPPQLPDRLTRAFTDQELSEVFALLRPISRLRKPMRDFFLVALLWGSRGFSRAVPDGGWFRWQQWSDRSADIRKAFQEAASTMIRDVQAVDWPEQNSGRSARKADARKLPLAPSSVDGLITSPPYANRHDYSRVFHISLLLLGMVEQEVTRLRHRSIRSHVEAREPAGYRRSLKKWRHPASLDAVLSTLPEDADPRIKRLLRGYFEDIHLSLLEVERVLVPGGRAAYVLGNVRHAGVMVPVDEIVVDLAGQVGLSSDAGWVMRLRGNAAQQMGRYGREPSRESVILLTKGGSP